MNIKLFGFIVLTVLLCKLHFDNDSKEQYKLDNFAAIFLILLLSLTLLFGYKYLDLHEEYVYEKFTVALGCLSRAVMCYL
jgi:purine-cytosine permease-like protein